MPSYKPGHARSGVEGCKEVEGSEGCNRIFRSKIRAESRLGESGYGEECKGSKEVVSGSRCLVLGPFFRRGLIAAIITVLPGDSGKTAGDHVSRIV